MVTEKELSILSLHTYRVDVQRINEPLQGSWTILKNRTEGSGGFAYAVFQKGSEIVIAFRGSDETADYIGNLGLTTTQERQAAMVAAQFIN